MWCYSTNSECYLPSCEECGLENYNHPSHSITGSPRLNKYNYKCSCGGEFIQPTAKQRLIDAKADWTEGYWVNYHICPFCNKEMEGLKE